MSSIHYIHSSSDLFSKSVEKFKESLTSEDMVKDDLERWSFERIKKYKFDECVYTEVNGKIVNMTFNKWYDNFLRIGINSYTLAGYRTKVFRPIWKESGYLDLIHKKHCFSADGYFCTFYAKNSKIESVVRMLKKKSEKRSFTFGGADAGWLSKLNIINDTPIIFRSVPQYISYFNNLGVPGDNSKKLLQLIRED